MIPMSSDVRELIGDWADQVDNRSLLHEKFALPKVWGVGEEAKLNDAGRWTVLRIVSRGPDLLRLDASRLRREAHGRNVEPRVRERKERDATIADSMARVTQPDRKLAQAANRSASHFLADISQSYSGRVVTFEATLAARLMVNLAGGVVENAGIALDRCLGLPFIPGSAVKGITRAQALWEIKQANPEDLPRLLKLAMLLFGFGANDIKGNGDFAWAGGAQVAAAIVREINATEFKGCACFLPANPTTPPELVVDMVNPHYPEYYRGRRLRATDDESPIPNYFPAVKEGSTFGFAVLLNRTMPDGLGVTANELLQQVRLWIEHAVTQKGAGAKTAAGYGWFELGRGQSAGIGSIGAPSTRTGCPDSTEAEVSPADRFIAKWRGKLTTKDNFPVALPEMVAIVDDTDLKRAFDAVIPENDRRRTRKNHPYWQAFTSGKHSEIGKRILVRLGLVLT